MERCFTDAVYARRVRDRPPELESGEEYLRIEEELNHFCEELGKELFGRGFVEGVHFFLQCLSS